LVGRHERSGIQNSAGWVRCSRPPIKTEGTEKAYAEISDPRGPFVDHDLCMDGLVLAHKADKNRIGTNCSTTRMSTARNS